MKEAFIVNNSLSSSLYNSILASTHVGTSQRQVLSFYQNVFDLISRVPLHHMHTSGQYNICQRVVIQSYLLNFA